ncbi:hypothetical protein DX887_23290 [Vibrio alginolyticus]|uniref:hypothetical protein n=1 Tax=Vibrio TaxID=662 RepID=UPI00215C1DD9|nr:hypothetical protein [Vibrio alginolyticus]EGR2558720.1 hypothetical protein [Vibrio alginolyticus]EJV5744034.1 hypothetical protein [Vibrio alginolyticus]EKD1484763.1 hypothetical protein [Vibrio alginolyticus]MCR9453676.1 hypothetical protein [Vibrio alginolyticus]MCR9462276.1 hypothetical protein [Vibrio alginolyticus]
MKLSKSLEVTLKKDDLKSLAIDLGEVGIDSLMASGICKDIPILSTILGSIGVVGNIRDALFVKKLISFLTEISDIPVEQRRTMIESIEASDDYRAKVGEKLIYIIERSEDHYSSRIIATFFAAFLDGEITYNQFLKINRIIDTMYIGDFLAFAQGSYEQLDLDSEDTYINTGLVDVSFEPVTVEDNDDYKSYGKYVTSGGPSLYVTPIGETVRTILRGRNYT